MNVVKREAPIYSFNISNPNIKYSHRRCKRNSVWFKFVTIIYMFLCVVCGSAIPMFVACACYCGGLRSVEIDVNLALLIEFTFCVSGWLAVYLGVTAFRRWKISE